MKKLISLASLSLIILLFNSCGSTSSVAKTITIESGQVPPGMKTESFILIGTLTGRKSYDKYVKKNFEEYTGKYILATEEEIKTKYSDVSKYRYVMDYEKSQENMRTDITSKERHIVNYYRYFILDRKENKEYVRRSASSFYALEMKAYLEAIEGIRAK